MLTCRNRVSIIDTIEIKRYDYALERERERERERETISGGNIRSVLILRTLEIIEGTREMES